MRSRRSSTVQPPSLLWKDEVTEVADVAEWVEVCPRDGFEGLGMMLNAPESIPRERSSMIRAIWSGEL
jgi:hypothetical protein